MNISIRSIFNIIAVAVLTSACGNLDDSVVDNTANYVFTNAGVYTVNERQPWAEAVAVKDNKIVYVGAAAGAKTYVCEWRS